MLVNKKAVLAILLEADNIEFGDYMAWEQWRERAQEMLFAYDEKEVIDFIVTADDDTKHYIYLLYEELIEKFPSVEMEEAIDPVIEWVKAYRNEIYLLKTYSEHWEECFDGKRHWTYDEWMQEWPTYEDYKRTHPITDATAIAGTQAAIQDVREGR